MRSFTDTRDLIAARLIYYSAVLHGHVLPDVEQPKKEDLYCEHCMRFMQYDHLKPTLAAVVPCPGQAINSTHHWDDYFRSYLGDGRIKDYPPCVALQGAINALVEAEYAVDQRDG